MKFIRNLIVLLLIAAGALYYTNPDQEAFSVFLADYVQEELADEHPGESEIGKAFRKGIGQIAGAAGSQLAERQDLTVASVYTCLLYTSPSPRDATLSRMPSSA